MSPRLAQSLFRVLHRFGMTRLAGWLNRHHVMILCYHGVTELAERSPEDPAGLHVTRSRFQAQLAYLCRRYRVISLAEFVAAKATGASLEPYTAIVTFDDGRRNFLTVAAPMLAALGVPASLFVVTDWVGDGEQESAPTSWSPEDDRSFLSWSDLRTLLANGGVEIGSHTCSHADLPALPPDVVRRELEASLGTIRERLGSDILALAYPEGRYDEAVIDLTRRAGYRCALTTDAGGNRGDGDLFRLRRTLIGDGDDEASFACRVTGLTPWLSGLSLIGSVPRLRRRGATAVGTGPRG